MQQVNWDTYKFRASSLPNLMTKARSKSEILSETAKACLREIWIKETFGREKIETRSKFTDKGVSCESDSLELVKQVLGVSYFKNNHELSNDWIKGTPDVVVKDRHVIDIKTSWDIWTFAAVDGEKAEKDYFYQLLGYMWLTGLPVAKLMYCLVDTPEEIIADELFRLSFKYKEIGQNEEQDKKYRANYIFNDIDPKLRVKEYSFSYVEAEMEAVKGILMEARKYLSGLHL